MSDWEEFSNDDPSIVGIKRLACAIIIRAALDIREEFSATTCRNSKKWERNLIRESKYWLFESDNETYPLSFRWCCDVLNIGYKDVQKRLIELKSSESIKRFFYTVVGVKIFERAS